MKKHVNCPQCGKKTEWKPENPFRPFCTERCKLIDFGAWAKEEHVISGNNDFDDYMSEDSDPSRRSSN